MRFVLYASVAINVATFFLFGADKRHARLGKRRVPEATLILCGFLTGFVGAWWGMSVFRHKTQKLAFRARLAAVTVLNPAWLLLWLHYR